jgi:hypothetical protein
MSSLKPTRLLAPGDVVTLDNPAHATWWRIRSHVGTDDSGTWLFDAVCVDSPDRTRIRETALFGQYGTRNVYLR